MPERGKNYRPKLVAYIAPISSVSEGTKVLLDGSQSYYTLNGVSPGNSEGGEATRTVVGTRVIKEEEDRISYFWKQIDGPKVSLENANTAKPTFIAPYINTADRQNSNNSSSSNGSQPTIYTTLKFQLIVKDKEGVSSEPAYEEVVVKIVQKVLVLQGGGALGAYELGVVKNLVQNMINTKKNVQGIVNVKDNSNNNNNNNYDRPLFDIVAGTSIGAVNAAIIVGNVIRLQKENPTLDQSEIWNTAVEELERFWHEISDPFTMVPKWVRNTHTFEMFLNNWNILSQFNDSIFDAGWHLIRQSREVWNHYYNYYNQLSKQVTTTNTTNATTNTHMDKAVTSEKNNNYYFWDIDNDGEGGIYNPYRYYVPVFTDEWPYIKWLSSEENWKEEVPYIQSYFYLPENYGPIATVEGLRRYYSVAASMMLGVPKVLTPPIYQPDRKFFGPTFTRMDNAPLARTIKKYWNYDKYPIKTSFEDRQPRLFLVSVDALDATSPVTFDSYVKENGICKTEYGDEEYRHVIEYPDGIEMKHVMSSMSVHLKHRYPEMEAKSSVQGESQKVEIRYMWDGAYLSNTPLREVLYEHRNYWRNFRNIQVKLENGTTEIIVPDMEVYIINLYPSVENELPLDADTIQDREIDIKFHDRTKYDLRLAQIATDYIEFIEALESLALKYSDRDKEFKRDYNALLDKVTRSKTRVGMKPRTYRDLVKGRFDIVKAIHVERSDDGNTIFGKASEFTSKTINQLKEEGYQDAETTMEVEYAKEIISSLAERGIIREEDEALFMERRLQIAMIHAKHQNIDKATEELSMVVESLKDIVTKAMSTEDIKNEDQRNKETHEHERRKEDNNIIFEFSKSISKLIIQLLINRLTIAVSKDIITERRGEELKQRLQEIKASVNNPSSLSNRNYEEQVDHDLHEFLDELNDTDKVKNNYYTRT